MLSNVENDFIHSIEMLEKIEDSNISAKATYDEIKKYVAEHNAVYFYL